jgi:hypothetical protein
MAGVLRGKRHLLVRSQPWRWRRERGLRLAREITLVVLSSPRVIVTAVAHSTATPAKSEKCEHSSTEQKPAPVAAEPFHNESPSMIGPPDGLGIDASSVSRC